MHLKATCNYFTNLVPKCCQGTSVPKCCQGTSEHVKRSKEKLKAIQPAQYPGEDIDLMWIGVSVLVDELIACNV
jgi:hypothetical protein